MRTTKALVLLGALTLGGSPGRAFRVRGRPEQAPTITGGAWGEGPVPEIDGLSAEDRAALAKEWLRDARAEHASIPAFSVLSLDLIALGATPGLVERCHEAALDEVRHARACFALASTYAGRPLDPGSFPHAVAARVRKTGRDEIERLAIESLTDGCLGEGFAAAAAAAGAVGATDPVVRAMLAGIAADETRHAELGWSILEWCLDAGDESVRSGLARALEEIPVAAPIAGLPDCESGDALSAHGRVGRATLARLWTTTRGCALDRARALVS